MRASARRPLLAVLALLLLAAVGRTMIEERGVTLGVLALFFYGGLAATALFRWDDLVAFGRRYPLADRALMGPIAFFGLAALTDLPLLVCAAIAAVAAAVFMATGARRRPRGA